MQISAATTHISHIASRESTSMGVMRSRNISNISKELFGCEDTNKPISKATFTQHRDKGLKTAIGIIFDHDDTAFLFAAYLGRL